MGQYFTREMPPKRPVLLLSLDGGGVRALSSLMILKHIMQKVNEDRGTGDRLEPFQVFDLIGGTGTGGLIALLLGRLQMPLDEVEEHYLALSQSISDHKRYLVDSVSKDVTKLRGKFDSGVLKEDLKKLIKGHIRSRHMANEHATGEHPPDEAFLLKGPNMKDFWPSCGVLVLSKHHGNKAPAIFRTYKNDKTLSMDSTYDTLEIWEAALATMAVKPFFDPFEIKDHEDYFINSKWEYNNPTLVIYEEARSLWPKSNEVFVLSIGTGGASSSPMEQLGPIAKSLGKLSIATCQADGEFISKHPEMARDEYSPRSYRFDVDKSFGVDEYEQRDNIAHDTEIYLKSCSGNVEKCVGRMKKLIQKALSEDLRTVPAELCSHCHIGITFGAKYKFCALCYTNLCTDCEDTHKREHTHASRIWMLDAQSRAWSTIGNTQNLTKECCHCHEWVKCRTEWGTEVICGNCIEEFGNEFFHKPAMVGNEVIMIRPPHWHTVAQGEREACTLDKGKECVSHCKRCGKGILVGDFVYNCRDCNEEYSLSQQLCGTCKADDPGHGHKLWAIRYEFEDTKAGDAHGYLKCDECSGKFPLVRDLAWHFPAHEHASFKYLIGRETLEKLRTRAFRRCPNRHILKNEPSQEGHLTTEHCKLCDLRIQFGVKGGFCLDCKCKFCDKCFHSDNTLHAHNYVMPCEIKEIPHGIIHIISHEVVVNATLTLCQVCGDHPFKPSSFVGYKCSNCHRYWVCAECARSKKKKDGGDIVNPFLKHHNENGHLEWNCFVYERTSHTAKDGAVKGGAVKGGVVKGGAGSTSGPGNAGGAGGNADGVPAGGTSIPGAFSNN